MRSSLLSSVALLSLVLPGLAQTWKNVRLGGGGGFVPGIVFHPKAKGVAYARTDIGGLYKLNSDDSWTALTDNMGQDATWHDWGIDAVAVDPNNADKVYAAVGMYTNSWDPNNGAIIRSSDGGSTWQTTNLSFKVGGNMPGRGMGERLAVDPNNSNIIYFGARSGNGLWKSTDGGVTFSKVSSFTAVGTYVADASDSTGYQSDIMGLAWITFDSTSSVSNGATSRIFVGTADKTNSVYVSNDAGATWKAVPGQPTGFLPHKCKLQPEQGNLYLTYSNTSGPYDGGNGSVQRYNIANGTWTDITPVSGSDLFFGFGGLAVDMKVPGTIMVASLNSWWPDAQLFRSKDSGATWSPIWAWNGYPNINYYYSMSTNLAPWITSSRASDDTKVLGWMIESMEIDPFDSDHWLYGTGLTIYGGHDLTKWDTVHNVSIRSLADGIEETSVQGLASVPGGPTLLVAVGDDNGFTFATDASLNTAPAKAWAPTPGYSTTTDVDYAGNQPKNAVTVGNNQGSTTPQVALSTDSGNSWNLNYAAQSGQYGGKIAYGADADVILWSSSSSGVLRSLNQGAFSAVSALPSGSTIASDKRNGNYFYAGSGAKFYVSSDKGATFSAGAALGSSSSISDIAVNPKVAGDVWVSTDAGNFHSTDYGKTFTQSTGPTKAYAIALGKGSGTYPNVYAFCTVNGTPALYASADQGKTWQNIQGAKGFGSLSSNVLAASSDTAGLVFVGTNGRGVFQATVTVTGSPSSSTTSQPSTTTSSTTLKTTTKTAPSTTTTSTATKTSSTSSTKTTTTATASSTAVAQHWAQCGGIGYTGPTTCAAGYTCQVQNPWYSQCL